MGYKVFISAYYDDAHEMVIDDKNEAMMIAWRAAQSRNQTCTVELSPTKTLRFNKGDQCPYIATQYEVEENGRYAASFYTFKMAESYIENQMRPEQYKLYKVEDGKRYPQVSGDKFSDQAVD